MQLHREENQVKEPEGGRARRPEEGRADRVFGAFKRNPGKLALAGGIFLLSSWIGLRSHYLQVEASRPYEAGKSELVLRMEKLEGEKGVEKLEETLKILEEKVDPRGWVNISLRMRALEALKEIISAENFDSSRLALVDAMAIERGMMCSAEEPLLGENSLSELRKMFKDPNFRPVLGSIALEESKKTGASAISYLRNFLGYPAVNPITVLHVMNEYGDGAHEVLSGLQGIFSNPNFRDAPDGESLALGVRGMLSAASGAPGENSEGVKKVLASYFANPNFSRSEMHNEERAKEICGIIRNALREEFEEISAMDAVIALTKNPNFKIDMLDGKLLADMQKTLKRVKCYYWRERSDAFRRLLESPAFLPKMLDPKDLRGALCVMRLANKQEAEVPTRVLQAVEKFANSRYALGVANEEGLGQKEREERIRKMWQTFRIVIKSVGEWDALKLASFCDRFPSECRQLFEGSCRKPGVDCVRAANAIKQILSSYKDFEGASFLPLLEDILGKKRANSPGQSKEFALSGLKDLGPEEKFASSYSEARVLSGQLGIQSSVAAFLNVEYAIRTIGTEETKRLNQEYGIEYFTRYSKELTGYFGWPAGERPKTLLGLLAMNSRVRSANRKPVLLLAYAKSDWNDVLSMTELGWVERAYQKYEVVAIEAKNEKEFYQRVAFVGKMHGRIGALMVNGHGRPSGIGLWGGESDQSNLDVGDEDEIAKLKEYFYPDPIILLDACSAGATKHGIGAVFSRALGASVFAPKVPIGSENIMVGPFGEIISVEYYADDYGEGMKNTRIFKDGKIITPLNFP